MKLFREFLAEAASDVDLRKEPYASKIKEIFSRELSKRYSFLGKVVRSDFGDSTKAEPSLFLYFDIKGKVKELGSSRNPEPIKKDVEQWIMDSFNSGLLEPLESQLPNNRMIAPRGKPWIIADDVYVVELGKSVDCYKVCIGLKVQAKPRATKPKKVRVTRDKYSGDFRKIEAIVKDVLKQHVDGTEVIAVDCEIEENNVYPTVIFSKLNRERAYEGRRVLKNSLSDLEKALKNYPVEIPDDPRIWDDDEYDFVTMALPYNEDDE